MFTNISGLHIVRVVGILDLIIINTFIGSSNIVVILGPFYQNCSSNIVVILGPFYQNCSSNIVVILGPF